MGAINYSSFHKDSLKQFCEQYIHCLDNSFLEISQMLVSSNQSSFSFNFFFILFEAVKRFPELLKMEIEFHKKDMTAWCQIISTAREKREIASFSSDEDIANLFLYCADGVFLRSINNENAGTFSTLLHDAFQSIYMNLKI